MNFTAKNLNRKPLGKLDQIKFKAPRNPNPQNISLATLDIDRRITNSLSQNFIIPSHRKILGPPLVSIVLWMLQYFGLAFRFVKFSISSTCDCLTDFRRLIDWLTRNDSWMYFVFQLLSLKVFCILGHLSKVIDKNNWNMYFVIYNWNTLKVFDTTLHTHR